MIKCNCCGKRVANKNIWTKGSILFNGCQNCWRYLTGLMEDLKYIKKYKCREKFIEEGTGKIVIKGQFVEGLCYYAIKEAK